MSEGQMIAKTILNQLGGNRFIKMTGANMFAHGKNYLQFRIPKTINGKDGINYVKIELMPSDTYQMTFGRIRGLDYKDVAVVTDVYCDMLESVFEANTGYATRL